MRVSCAQPDPAAPQPFNAYPGDGRRAQCKPDANLPAFAQRGDHRVEPAINECGSRCCVRTLTFRAPRRPRLIAGRTNSHTAAVEKPPAGPS